MRDPLGVPALLRSRFVASAALHRQIDIKNSSKTHPPEPAANRESSEGRPTASRLPDATAMSVLAGTGPIVTQECKLALWDNLRAALRQVLGLGSCGLLTP
jgi:hypothetical protein